MKKILLITAMLAVLMMTGCNKKEKIENNNQQSQEIQDNELNTTTNDKTNESNEIQEKLNNNEAIRLFNEKFHFTSSSIETALGQIAGTSTYTIDNNDLIRRDLTSPGVSEADAVDETEIITSNINKKIIGLDKGYSGYQPEILVKYDDDTLGIVTHGDSSIKSLDVEQYMILNKSYGDYTNDSKDAVLTIGPSSPENNYGLLIKFNGNTNYDFTTGEMDVELDTANNLITFPTTPNGPYKTDLVEKIKYELNNLKMTKISVEFKDGKNIDFIPNDI